MSDDTREVYERARLGQSVTPGSRPAVLVVDFSRGFTDPESTMGSDLTAEVGATNLLLAAARQKEIPVIFTTIGFESNLKDGSLWLQKAPGLAELQVGGEWVEIDPRLERRDRAQAPHEANLVDIQAKYADVVSAEDALAYLESVGGRVGAPK
jgi:nicotinamidase-related amidase